LRRRAPRWNTPRPARAPPANRGNRYRAVRSGIQLRQDSLARLEHVEPHIVAMDTRVGSAECGRERRQLTEQLDPNESLPITTTVS
jgi:hypothetical protein